MLRRYDSCSSLDRSQSRKGASGRVTSASTSCIWWLIPGASVSKPARDCDCNTASRLSVDQVLPEITRRTSALAANSARAAKIAINIAVISVLDPNDPSYKEGPNGQACQCSINHYPASLRLKQRGCVAGPNKI